MDFEAIATGITSLLSIVSTITSSKKPNGDATITSNQLIELQGKLITVQTDIFKLIEDNHILAEEVNSLKKKLSSKNDVIRHKESFITLKGDELGIKYCSTCYGKSGILIQLEDDSEGGTGYCPVCKDRYIINQRVYQVRCETALRNSYNSY